MYKAEVDGMKVVFSRRLLMHPTFFKGSSNQSEEINFLA